VRTLAIESIGITVTPGPPRATRLAAVLRSTCSPSHLPTRTPATTLPYEVYDLTVKITWLRLGALAINLLLVIYLVWSKRLFGVRGGKAAHQSRLRSESFIEVEQAALAAASRPGADMPH